MNKIEQKQRKFLWVRAPKISMTSYKRTKNLNLDDFCI